VYVACSTLCFGRKSLDEALHAIREMRYAKADLAVHDGGPHLTPSDIAADVGKVVTRLKAANLPLAALHVKMDPTAAETRDRFRVLCRFARLMTVPVLTVPAADAGGDFDADVKRLCEWTRVAESEGVILTVETHSATLTADPLAAAELCRRVRGLGLTLDPSHYFVGPHAPANFDPLIPFVRHVRLRDTGTGEGAFQVRVGQGEVEFGRIVAQLDRVGYDRALTVDIPDQPEGAFPVEPEVRKLKYLLESLV
jgi:sugar phosphate isomerase/epimerase